MRWDLIRLDGDRIVVTMPYATAKNPWLRLIDVLGAAARLASPDMLATSVTGALHRLEQPDYPARRRRMARQRVYCTYTNSVKVWSRVTTDTPVALDDILTAATDAAADKPKMAEYLQLQLRFLQDRLANRAEAA